MPNYAITFRGRTAGAIGIFYTITACRAADTPEAAVLALQEPAPHDAQAFEHVSQPGVREVAELARWQERGR